MLSSSELKFINVRSWFFDRHRNLCFDLFRKTCCHGTLSRLAYSMIDYLSFPDNTILIIIDIHTSSFRSMFALLQCLCHCRPWIIQNYKIMSLFLTCCCASSRIFFLQNLSSGSVGDEEKWYVLEMFNRCLYLYLYFSKIYPMVVWEMRRGGVFLKCSIVVFPTNAFETLSAKSTLLTGHRRQSGWGWCGKQFENMGN